MIAKLLSLFESPDVRQARVEWERIDAECARIESSL